MTRKKPLCIINRSTILTSVKNGVRNIQTADYNGAHRVFAFKYHYYLLIYFFKFDYLWFNRVEQWWRNHDNHGTTSISWRWRIWNRTSINHRRIWRKFFNFRTNLILLFRNAELSFLYHLETSMNVFKS